jgi:hypothetical protein
LSKFKGPKVLTSSLSKLASKTLLGPFTTIPKLNTTFENLKGIEKQDSVEFSPK